MTHNIIGFHGTSTGSAKEILKSNYELSIGDNHWVGDGVYFFIEGISSKPDEQSKKWAKTQAWDNLAKKLNYKFYCIIKSDISVNEDKLLDLTKEDGVEILSYIVRKYEAEIKKLGKKVDYYEGLLINLARGEGLLDIQVVKGNFYIKFAEERIRRINLRTPNCTICTVFEPKINITSSIIVSTGEIKDEVY